MSFTHNSTLADSEPTWGDVDKTRLPRAAFADHGDPDAKSTWKYPHHWVRDNVHVDDAGVYSDGTMFLHAGGLDAAWSAAQGARSGQDASPAVKAHLQTHRSATDAPVDANRALPAALSLPAAAATIDPEKKGSPLRLTTGQLQHPVSAQPGKRQYHVTLIAAGPTLNNWVLPHQVLEPATPLFDGAACLLDHPGLFEGPRLAQLAGTYTDPTWTPDHTITATLTLANTPVAALLQTIVDTHLDDTTAGLPVPPIGLSADLTVQMDYVEDLRICTAIDKVWSVDAVLHPAAGGAVERVLNSIQQQETIMPPKETPPPEITEEAPTTQDPINSQIFDQMAALTATVLSPP